MVSNGKHANTIAARYERLRARADEEAREAGQWPPRKGPKSGLTINERYERLQAKEIAFDRCGRNIWAR